MEWDDAKAMVAVNDVRVRLTLVLLVACLRWLLVHPWKKPEIVEKGGKVLAIEIDSPPNDTKRHKRSKTSQTTQKCD